MAARSPLLLVLGLLILAGAVEAQSSLLQCLDDTESRVVAPADPDYDTARQVLNKRITSLPLAVVYPYNSAAVTNIVLCCKNGDVRLSVRAGGHSYEGYSTLNSSVVVDLSVGFNYYANVSQDVAVVGAGTRLGTLYYEAWQNGVAFPGGTCPGVGLAGLAMGGGWGLLARKHGLACDHILGVQLINANGTMITVNSRDNADLLWAVKGGGGGNFGIVTQFTLQMPPAPQTVTYVILSWELAQAVQLMQLWQEWAPSAPDEFTSQLEMHSGDETSLHGIFLGSKVECDDLLQSSGLLGVPGVRYSLYGEMSFVEALLQQAYLTQRVRPDAPINLTLPPNVTMTLSYDASYKAKSLDVQQSLGSDAMQAIQDATTAFPAAYVQFASYGGAINRVPANATAFARRDLLFSIQMYVSWVDPGQEAASLAWINDLQARLGPLVNGGQSQAYLNYIDADLSGWQSAYYGAALPRLQSIKAKYDPGNFFRGPQSIPLPTV